MGQVYLRQGKHSEAELYFKNALKIQPTYYRSLYNLGYLKNAVSQYSEAVVYLKDSLVHNAKNSQAWGSLGFAYLELLELDESLRCLDEALKIDPQYRNALNNKAKVLLSMGRLEEAYKCCEFSCGVDPNSEVTFDLKGTILENMGKLKESLVCFKEAIRIDPNYSRPWASLGFVYIQLHSWQEALNALNSALSLEPNYPLVLKNKSYTLIQLGRYAEAKESADKALEISPNFDEAWFCKGLALFALKEYQLASIAFDKVILLQSGHFIYALNYKGLALDYLKNEDSRIYYTEAIKVDARTTAEWYVSIRPVHGKVCTIPIARKTVSGPVTPSHPVHEQLSPPSTASSSPNEKSPVSPRKNISIKVGQGTIRSPIGKKPILHSQKSTVKEGNPKDGTVANRMNFEGTVGGAGRPLLIFPRTYIVPTTDIHEAALRGMGDKWKEYQIRFSEIITEHITKTQITKDAIIKYNLTFEEAAAIVYYTADASIFGGTYLDNLYIILNQQLAQRQVDDNFKPFLYYLIRGLHKLPSFVGVVYRGVSKPITSLSAQYRVGNQIVWVAFTSTSKSRHIMHKFSKSQTSGGTWMQLKVNQGKDIAEFSLCDEGEVLLMPNTYFILKEFLSVDMKELAGLPSDLDCLVMEQQDTPNSVKSMFES
uniref:NAD(P)(+)--arginine ADP-ribosyltransferase n=1 Tax=Arcella intermedia TaxID=1963864 RepID=A0A6B2KZ74_9EUKA